VNATLAVDKGHCADELCEDALHIVLGHSSMLEKVVVEFIA